ncbi:MAG: ABC transporter ATP-binding protein [Actinomycetota bacterium]
MALLEVKGLHAGYGDVEVLYGLDFAVEQGETAVFLGLNGAGKTTTMHCLAGLHKPSGGSISFDGVDIAGRDVKQMVRRGIVLVPEGRRVFPALSVERNLAIGAWTKRRKSSFVSERKEQIFDYFPRLAERQNQLAGTLSGGEQQMLALARGLMSDPKLLLIDEASLGLAPVIVKQLFSIIGQINATGVTVLLVEQNIGAIDIADQAVLMEKGNIVYRAKGKQLDNREKLREAFLGAPA